MDTKTRRLDIIERVLHLDDDTGLSMIEQVLEMLETAIPGEDDIPPMPPRSAAELAADLEEARADIKAGRTFTQAEVLTLTQQWRAA